MRIAHHGGLFRCRARRLWVINRAGVLPLTAQLGQGAALGRAESLCSETFRAGAGACAEVLLFGLIGAVLSAVCSWLAADRQAPDLVPSP